MKDITKQTIKRWIISSIVSFLAGFVLVIYNDIDSITLESFTNGGFVGLLFVAIRTGFKGLLELILFNVKPK